MLMLFSTFMPFLSVCMSQHGIRMDLSNVKRQNTIQKVNTRNLMTFECCFLISKYHENCSTMSSFTVLRHVLRNIFICSAVRCFHQFVMVIIYCLLSFFSDAADNKHSYVVKIPVKCSAFKCNIQKSITRSLQITYIVIFKNRNMQLRFKVAMTDIRDQLMTNEKLSELG